MKIAPLPIHLKSIIEIVTVGFPFCGFKLLTGLYLRHLDGQVFLSSMGMLLMILGMLDLMVNTANLLSFISVKRRIWSSCVAAGLSRYSGRSHHLGEAFDVFLSFTLVALMVAFGAIPELPGFFLGLWNASVVINVLGAGVGRLASTLDSPGSIQN
jgi:hypothetical protein